MNGKLASWVPKGHLSADPRNPFLFAEMQLKLHLEWKKRKPDFYIAQSSAVVVGPMNITATLITGNICSQNIKLKAISLNTYGKNCKLNLQQLLKIPYTGQFYFELLQWVYY